MPTVVSHTNAPPFGMLPNKTGDYSKCTPPVKFGGQLVLLSGQINDASPMYQSFEHAQLCRQVLKTARMSRCCLTHRQHTDTQTAHTQADSEDYACVSGCCLTSTFKQPRAQLHLRFRRHSQVLHMITMSTFQVDSVCHVLQGQMLCHV